MGVLTLEQVSTYLLRKQHLANGARADSVVQLARDIAGLHATGNAEPYIAAHARTRHFAKDDLTRALNTAHSLVKLRYVRATLYILPRETVPVAHAALRSVNVKLTRRYAAFMGVSEADYERVSRRVLGFLEGRELKPAEIKSMLGEDLHLPSVLNVMCDEGLILRVHSGSYDKPRDYRYAVFAESLPDVDLERFTEEEATARLVGAYLAAFGPATVDDIAWWTGLARGRINGAIAALKNGVVGVDVEKLSGEHLMLAEDLPGLRETRTPSTHTVNLLPTLDPYMMGYKLRARYLTDALHPYVYDRGGNAVATILLDGRVAGVWDISDRAHMKLLLFQEVAPAIKKQIEDEAGRTAVFVTGNETGIGYVSEMTPLAKRSAGGFMSPLRDARE